MSPSQAPNTLSKVSLIINEVIKNGPYIIPEEFNGTGAPGEYLEHLCDVVRNNFDSPDLFDWELKFHGGSSLITLFHKTPQPRGVMTDMVHNFGWRDEKNRISFRYTHYNQKSDKGFYLFDNDKKLYVLNNKNVSIAPFWEHNTILEAISSKLRRMIFVEGDYNRGKKKINYLRATALWDLDMVRIINLIMDGKIIIDFDARTKSESNPILRDHGTKFRIRSGDLPQLFQSSRVISETKNLFS